MITKLTSVNNELYQARFAMMNKAFAAKELDLEIKSLEEYFANIHTIAEFVQDYPEYTSMCFAMPVDEPVFEIDANSRMIAIPAEFKKNGIGVLGDHQAETVYFKIDQYFDYQSFYKLINDDENGHVVINWAFTPSGSKAIEASGSVEAFGPCDNLEPGYFIFGWIIDKSMTVKAGSLTFSVQFYHLDPTSGEMDYSFSTLTSSVNVGNTLIVKNPSEVKPISNTLFMRLKNSAYRVDGITGPAVPVWILDLLEEENMPFASDDTQEELVLVAEAGIEKGITIQYRWFATIAGESEPIELSGTDMYVPTETLAAEDNVLYYTKSVVDEHDVYSLLVGQAKDDAFVALAAYAAMTDEEKAEAEVPTPVYERRSVISVNKAGRYAAQANAKVDISDSTWESLSEEDRAQVEALTKSIDSTVCEVPAASIPVVSLNVESNLDPDSFEIIDPEVNEFVYVDSESAPSISASVEEDKLGALAVLMLDADGNIIGTDPKKAFEDLNEADMDDYEFTRYSDAISVSNGLSEQGQYKVGIINRLNNTYAIGESKSIKTSFVAPEIKAISVYASLSEGDPITLLDSGETPDGEMVQIDLNNVVNLMFVDDGLPYNEYENISIKYFLQEVDAATLEPVEEVDPSEIELTTPTFMPADSGYYRIKTVAEYNNTRRVGYTDLFSVYSI